MMLYVNMLRPLVVALVLSQTYCTLVILVYYCRRMLSVSQFIQYIAYISFLALLPPSSHIQLR